MKSYALIFAVWMAGVSYGSGADEFTAKTAFHQLSQLEGRWGVADGAKSHLEIEFKLTANDSVLLEQWMIQGRLHSLTVYHLDGKRLLATHYCPQGNQPRLVMTRDSVAENIKFSFLDATNLADPKDSHQHELSFEIDDPHLAMRRGEVYLNAGQKDASSLDLVRSENAGQTAVSPLSKPSPKSQVKSRP